MNTRKAYPDDIPLIRQLALSIWPATYASILSREQSHYMLERMYSEEALLADMSGGKDYMLIYDGEQAIGFTSHGWSAPGTCKLHRIYMLPAVQGRGFGRFAIEQVMAAARKAGASRLELNVNRHNKARGFYEKLGFTVAREEDIDIGNGFYMNDYVMEIPLPG